MLCDHRPGPRAVVALTWLALFAALLFLLGQLPTTLEPSGSIKTSSVEPKEVAFNYSGECSLLLNSGGWVQVPYVRCEPSTKTVATCGPNHDNSWQWGPEARQCGAARLSAPQARYLLQQKWVVMAGDSITRFMFASLLRLLADEDQQIVYGHRDFEYMLPDNIRATFLWAPYTTNITAHMRKWTYAAEQPDMLIVSTGLWHMLHIGNSEGYQEALSELKHQTEMFANKQVKDVRMHFLSITEVFPPKLKSDEKRQMLTLQQVSKYNHGLIDSKLLLPSGPFSLIDMHRLTKGCGADCTHDGLHYSNTTYDAALQIWVNTLWLH